MRDRLPAQAGLTVGDMWHVYMIRSRLKKWFYVGSTNRLEKRLVEHNNGFVQSTKSYRPFDLVFLRELEIDARNYEKKIKDRRIEKEQIIKSIENS